MVMCGLSSKSDVVCNVRLQSEVLGESTGMVLEQSEREKTLTPIVANLHHTALIHNAAEIDLSLKAKPKLYIFINNNCK